MHPPFIFSRETEWAGIDRSVRDPSKRQILYDMVLENGDIEHSSM
jgi:hypothetical protein